MDTSERRAAIERTQRYVEQLQPLMRLAHWQIIVHDDPPDNEECVADISCSPTRTMAALRISDHYIAQSSEKQRRSMVHELTHCHFHQLSEAEGAYLYAVGHPVWEHLHRRYEHMEELAVDEVARTIAPFLPPPPVAVES